MTKLMKVKLRNPRSKQNLGKIIGKVPIRPNSQSSSDRSSPNRSYLDNQTLTGMMVKITKNYKKVELSRYTRMMVDPAVQM